MTVTTSLADLYDLDDGSAMQQLWIDRAAAWFAGQHAAGAETGGGDGSAWMTGDAARGLACDAALFPVVLGHVDTQHLDDLIAQCVQIHRALAGDEFVPDRAAHLGRNLLGHLGLGGRSLPLDVGDRDDIPWQIRRAVQLRDAGTCQWPGGCG